MSSLLPTFLNLRKTGLAKVLIFGQAHQEMREFQGKQFMRYSVPVIHDGEVRILVGGHTLFRQIAHYMMTKKKYKTPRFLVCIIQVEGQGLRTRYTCELVKWRAMTSEEKKLAVAGAKAWKLMQPVEPEIQELGDQIAHLTLVQANDLARYLVQKFGDDNLEAMGTPAVPRFPAPWLLAAAKKEYAVVDGR